MADRHTWSVPYPISTNTYYRNFNGRMVMSSKGRAFKAFPLPRDHVYQQDDRLKVEIVLHAPTARKYDIDNYAKSCIDLFQHHGVIPNDNQIDELTIVRGEKKPPGSAIVTIETIEHGSANQ